MNSFWVVIRIPGFWMKILEAIFTAVGLTFIFDSYIDIYSVRYFDVVFSFLSTYLMLSSILIGLHFKRRPEKFTEKLLLTAGLLWDILSCFCVVLALYIGSKTVHLSKESTLRLLTMVSLTGITLFVDLILSVTTVYLIYRTYIEIHSIHTYHLLQCTAFTYFLICGTLITEYVTEETSHFTESMFLIVGIPMHAVSASLNLYYYFRLRDSELITVEFLLSGVFFIITGMLLFVDLLCIIYLDWPRDLRRERNPLRHGWWSGHTTRPRQDIRVSFKDETQDDVSSLILSVHLARNHVRYWIDREYHVFFISGSAGYLLISVIFIASYIKDRPNVLLESVTLLVLGIINFVFGILACCITHVEIHNFSLIPLGVMMILCGIVSLSDWLVQRIMGGWDRFYFPRRMAHSSHTIF